MFARPVDNLPPTARAIALLLSSTPSVQDAQPGVLHQLLEFAHRYTYQVLTDARVYAEHAGRQDRVDMDDIVLAVQARVGWEFGGRVPKEYILSLASQTNAIPLPAVPEVFGVRLPPTADCLTAIDFDLVPNRPPPGVPLYQEEIEEIEESESDSEEDMDMEPTQIPEISAAHPMKTSSPTPAPQDHGGDAPFPISAIAPMEVDMNKGDDGSDGEDGLFAGGDDEDDEDGMEEVETSLGKRKLQEEDDYD